MTRPSILIATLCVAAGFVLAQDAPRLVPGTPVEREIHAGEVHSYRLAIQAGQFVYVTAAQLGSDVKIRLIEPGGKEVSVDRLLYEGYEDLPRIATAAGDDVIEIKAGSIYHVGRYRLEVAVRAPTDQDRSRVAAYNAAWIDAPALRSKQNAASSREAVAKYELAADEAKKAGDPRWEAFALTEWANVIHEFGESAKARDLFLRCIELQRAASERASLSTSLNNLGAMYGHLGKSKEAIELYDQALAIRREVGDLAGQASAVANIGNAYQRLSQHTKSIEYLTRALELFRKLGDRSGEAATLSGLGVTYYTIGEFQTALEQFLAEYRIRETLNDKLNFAISTRTIGDSYYALGNSARARQYWMQADPLFREVGYTPGLANVVYGLGMDRFRRKEFAAAIRYLEEALELHRKIGNPLATANDLAALCRSSLALDDRPKTRARATEGLELSRKSNYPLGTGMSSDCLGRLELAEGDHERAAKYISEALEIFNAIDSRENRGQALASLADVERRRGDLPKALRYMEQATALAEFSRAQINDPDLRATYRASHGQRVEFQTALLMQMHRREPAAGYQECAFNLAEQWRARSLVEMIRESRADLRQELTAEQREREDRLSATVTRVQRDLFKDGLPAARQRELKMSLATAEGELNLFQTELRRSGSRYAAGQYAETLDAAVIRSRILDADAALIEYALGDAESYAWIVTRSGVASAPLLGRKEIEQHVETYRKLLSERVSSLTLTSALARLDAESAVLYRMLVEPLEGSLSSAKKVVIVPDGALAYVPFEVLRPAPARQADARLIERFSISYEPSASAIAALRDREQQRAKPGRSLLAFADPVFGTAAGRVPAPLAAYRERGFAFTRLPNSRQEVTGIRSLFPPAASHVYLGPEASEKSLRAENLDAYRFLHFAVHGYFDEEQPSRSGIVLSTERDGVNDGILQSPEIMRLNLNADLVTLSACQTGLGKVLAGEGVMGLTRAFFYAGAQSLVVSLWNVNDAATAELMRHFYANLKTGLPRDEALRQAKLSLMRTPGSSWRHPYYWAPFVFVGDPGRSNSAAR